MSDDIRSLDLDDFGRLCGIDPADFPDQARQIAGTFGRPAGLRI